MNGERIVKAAIPGASDAIIDYIIWGRTPYPCGSVSPKELYKAASGYKRACDNKISLCEYCDKIAMDDSELCSRCNELMWHLNV